ncbi:universal stress protein [uncultured Desulfosarcina sp.]|uniref:universal stress protein n=1 Tax=uncultured Desulfosarcina sp. TaxID=218289 RepID=UPI0029C875E3|nr:universal stress protein [uncultured Desulfosarcina sp.]
MLQVLSFLQKNLVWSIPISMSVGLLYGYLFDAGPLKQFIIPVTFVMVYPMMVTLNVKTIFKGQDYKLQLLTQVINFVLIPLLAFYTGKLFFSGGPEKYGLWAVGLFLIGVLPTSGMTISWTGFAKGNKEAAIKMVVFGLVLGALAAPVYTKVFMGATIDVDMLHMFKQIALFVFVPLIAGLLTQTLFIKKVGRQTWNDRIKPKFPPFSALGVILIAFLAMSLKAKNIIANPQDILTILLPLALFYLVTYGLLSIAGRIFLKREDAIAMVFGVVMRDLSIALAIAMTAFGKQGLTIALLIALAYVVQIQSAAWYVRFVGKIFGEKAKEPAPQKVPETVATVTPLPKRLAPIEENMVPPIRNILYATDLSDTARHAVRYACSMGNGFGARVTVLHVIPDVLDALSLEAGVDLADHMDKKAWKEFHTTGIQKAKEAIHRRIRETSRNVIKEIPHCPLNESNVLVKVGDPVRQIVSTAREGNFDLIVMGTHGHGKMEERIIGSTASDVIRTSRVPVMVVRLPAETAFETQPGQNNSGHREGAVNQFG